MENKKVKTTLLLFVALLPVTVLIGQNDSQTKAYNIRQSGLWGQRNETFRVKTTEAYKVWLNDNRQLEFAILNDSGLIIISYAELDLQDRFVHYRNIESLSLRKEKAVSRGVKRGIIAGAFTGAIVGFLTYKKPEGGWFVIDFGPALPAVFGAVLGALPGAGLGAIIGSAKKKFPINGNKEKFRHLALALMK